MKNAITAIILHTHTHTQRNTLSKNFLGSNNKEQSLSPVFSKVEKTGLFYFWGQNELL
jgi:hypothetical protein